MPSYSFQALVKADVHVTCLDGNAIAVQAVQCNWCTSKHISLIDKLLVISLPWHEITLTAGCCRASSAWRTIQRTSQRPFFLFWSRYTPKSPWARWHGHKSSDDGTSLSFLYTLGNFAAGNASYNPFSPMLGFRASPLAFWKEFSPITFFSHAGRNVALSGAYSGLRHIYRDGILLLLMSCADAMSSKE